MIALEPFLATERLRLSIPSEADAAGYMDMRAANKGWAAEHSWRNLAFMIGHWAMRGFGLYTVRAEGRFAGVVGAFFPHGWPEVELGWHLTPAEQGKGYATEAARAVRAHVAERLGARRLVSYIRATNAPSQAVARRLGAVRGGTIELPIGDGLPHPGDIWRHPDPLAEPALAS